MCTQEKPNINSKGGQGHNEEPNKLLNQSLQGGLEKVNCMSSNQLQRNYCKILNEPLI